MNGENVQQSLDAIRGIFRRGRTAVGAIDPLDYAEADYMQRPVRGRVPDPLDYKEGMRGAGRSNLMNAIRRMGGEGAQLGRAIRAGALTGTEVIALLTTIFRAVNVLNSKIIYIYMILKKE